MKTYKYSQIVNEGDRVLYLAPSVFLSLGGMFEYVIMWFSEFKLYTDKGTFLLKKSLNFPEDKFVVNNRIECDENMKKVVLASIFNLILPASFLSVFFKRDYEQYIKDAETIHVLSNSLNNYALFRWIRNKYPSKKIIFTLHDPKPHQEKISFLAKKIKCHALAKIFKLSKKKNFYIHLHSSELLKDCPSDVDNIIIHHHPLPSTKTKRSRVKDGKIRFGFMGRIEPYKGLSVLYQAFKKIDKELLNNVEIQIMGRGVIDDDWKNLPISVTINNELVTDDQFHYTMSNLDCLILPYVKASQSGVGYMALAYQIPIILSKTGGLVDVYKLSKADDSQLVIPGDNEALKEAIEVFIRNFATN